MIGDPHNDSSNVCLKTAVLQCVARFFQQQASMHTLSSSIVFSDICNQDEFAKAEQQVDQHVDALNKTVIGVRRHLHQFPEPSGSERDTTRYLSECLNNEGIDVKVGGRGVGLTADVVAPGSQAETPWIAMRADIDALRIQDRKPVAYSSRHEGLMHACGHDAHAAIVFACGVVAKRLIDQHRIRNLRLRLIFQPAEETCQGANWMIEHGAMEDIEAIFGVHVDPDRAVGTAAIRYGPLTAICDEVAIAVRGCGGHAARPHHTDDPVAAAAHLVTTLYKFLPRAVDSQKPSVFSVGRIQGGYAPNVIPDAVELHGTLRTVDETTRGQLRKRIEKICSGAAQLSETDIEVSFLSSLPAVNNDKELTAAMEVCCQRALGTTGVRRLIRPSMGGEDFAMYLNHAPGTMFRLGCVADPVDSPKLHTPLFDVDERSLSIGPRILLRAALLVTAARRATSH